jgi:hypothetical protein
MTNLVRAPDHPDEEDRHIAEDLARLCVASLGCPETMSVEEAIQSIARLLLNGVVVVEMTDDCRYMRLMPRSEVIATH